MEHRLPENHNCPQAPKRAPLGSYLTKKQIQAVHSKEIRRLSGEQSPLEILLPKEGKKIALVDESSHHFRKIHVTVPEEVWNNKEYRRRIQRAKTETEVAQIVFDYYSQHPEKQSPNAEGN
jgi:hypothetical protein